MVVAGPNGAGKSTLLKVLSGEWSPSAGRVWLADTLLQRWTPRALARRRAVLPQRSDLQFSFTALEVVLMGRIPHTTPGDYNLAVARTAMALTDIQALAMRQYPTLSGGERQRVQLARVLAQIWNDNGPRWLFLDEPTAPLDLAHQHRILASLRHFARRHRVGILIVLHDLNLAAAYSDRIMILAAGRKVAEGAPAEVLQEPLLSEVFAWPVKVLPHPLAENRPLVVVA
ncbi:iron complex transport system ATP-binding protein [Methylomarinovum caldicuralii]|uniref:Iron complex transport system ATP-binding protein n=1 Tax=Methylomarinovum caldicuralii TaxID=438856 RepID=A0AAU9C152_9GAMM|nr:iron complex transport system ATP-binding protein [Methylomarinovum caldicuralii]